MDRIEIVSDGCSALYGSDAVAGVANIILRKSYIGTDISVRIGGAVSDIFQQVGTGVTLARDPGRAPALYTDAEVTMAITPDGSTVLIAGNKSVVVQPTR